MSALTLVLIGLTSGVEVAPPSDPAAFPVPAEKGMKLDSRGDQFNVPFGFGKVEKFYRDQFSGRKDVALAKSESDAGPVLTITSLAKHGRWTKAVVTTNGATCRIAVKRVVVVETQTVSGEGPPVQFIIGRSVHAKEQVDSIDHLEH